MKTVLVTGATGFIGSNLCRALVNLGLRVRILRRPASDLRAIEGLDVEQVPGDIRDPEAVSRAVRGCDTVFHAAALVSYWRRERRELFEVNVGGTANVIRACLDAGVERLVHTSSVAAVGFEEDGRPATEETPFNWEPFDVGYRISKHRSEQQVLSAATQGLPAVVVNPSVVLGEGDLRFNGGQIIRDVYRKRIFYSVEGGINVVYVGDVVHGHLAAARAGRIGQRYILSGENLTHRKMLAVTAEVVGGIKPLITLPLSVARGIAAGAEMLSAVTGGKPWITRELLAGIHLRNWFSCDKAQRELGYDVTPFRTAVERTFTWYKTHQLL